MEDIILKPIAEVLAQTLCSAGVEEIKRLYNARGELSKLESTLSTIRAVLVDAEKRQISNEQVRNWLEKLETVLYDADDLVDKVNSEGLRRQLMHGTEIRKKVRTFFSSDNQLAFQHYLAGEIKKITERLDAISADKERFHFVTALPEETKVRVDSQSFVVGENVVGRDQDRRDFVELLLDHESSTKNTKVPVIPIVGMGGLGKTTLAQLVFNDVRVRQHFELKIWVCVSYNFDVKVICQKIINAIERGTIIGDSPMEELQRKLRESIKGKRYLLVLDDVWNLEGQDWVVLRDLLTTDCEEGSGIIVTTRHRWVADVMGTMQPYDLGILDPKDSWNLFKKMAFEHGRDPTNPTTEGIAKRILAKCGGVPLAITMIGRMSRFEDPETEWPSFLERDLPNITQQENEILRTLRLSYDYLPSHLKPCFAYCSLFPKDHEIDVQELILLWIAQGFIKPLTPSQNLEDIGYLYFEDLFQRSFFQEAERDRLKGFITCKMHDLVHDLAIQIAGRGYDMLSSGEANLEPHVRHISLDFNLNILREVPSQWLQAKRLRSFLLPIQSYNFIPTKRSIWDAIISNFRFLRMLTLRNGGLELVPKSVSELKHLRYLDLSGNVAIKELPTSITELVNLQTLKLTGCYNLLRLPEEISKLVNLRHLEFDESEKITHTPRGLGQLTNLQTLSQLVLSENPCSGKLDELMRLNLRGNLTIKGLKNGLEPKEAKLKDKKHLQSLRLDFTRRGDDALTFEQESEMTILEGLQPHLNLRELTVAGYGGDRFSSWLSSLTNLVKLRLENCSRCRQLPSLDRCHSLEELVLMDLDALEYITVNKGISSSLTGLSVLPSLQKLTLENLPDFRGWWRSDMAESQEEQVVFPSFPLLSSLTISRCPSLTSMPCYPNVEKMEMEFTSFERATLMRVTQAQISATTTTDRASSSSAASSSTTLPDELLSSASLSIYHLSKLLSLSLDGIVDLHHFPDEWMNGLASLKKLHFTRCDRLKYLTPYIHYLTSLEELKIANCQQFEGIEWPNTPALTSLRILRLDEVPNLKNLPSQGIQYLTSLEELEIGYCQQFKGIEWPETPALTSLRILKLKWLHDLKNLPSQGIQYLTSLEELEIFHCQQFKGIEWPETPALTSLRILKLTLLYDLKNLPSQGIQYLTSLEELEIADCQQFEGIEWPEAPALTSLRILKLKWLPQLKNLLSQGIQHLTSLEELEIANCRQFEGIEWPNTPALTSLHILKLKWLPELKNLLSQCFQHSLSELWIVGCPKLDVHDDSIQWIALTNLRTLQFAHLPQLRTLPEGLQSVTGLEDLQISGCNNFTGLQRWIHMLSSLQRLTIDFCLNFKSMPGSISSLTSLQHLEINGMQMDPREISEDLVL